MWTQRGKVRVWAELGERHWHIYTTRYERASLVAQLVKNPPAMWETWVWSLGWEDPPEKGMATHFSIPAWRIPWTVWGRKELDMTQHPSLSLSCVKQLVETYYIAQGTQLNALWWPRGVGWGEGKLKKEEIYVHTELIHTVVPQKPTQNCKAIILQK